jgi:hypothetical protein
MAESCSSSSRNDFGILDSSSHSASLALALPFSSAEIRGGDGRLLGAAFGALACLALAAAASACLLDFSFAQSFFITIVVFEGGGEERRGGSWCLVGGCRWVFAAWLGPAGACGCGPGRVAVQFATSIAASTRKLGSSWFFTQCLTRSGRRLSRMRFLNSGCSL